MPTLSAGVNPREMLDPAQAAALPRDSNDAPERDRRFLDCPPVVAQRDSCGAMARLIG
jgi:hypothetical protein